MLVATVIAAVLMGGVLTATVSLSRDRQRLSAREAGAHPAAAAAFELVRRDLANATATVGPAGAGGFALFGHGGIDPRTLTANGRFAAVAYRLDPVGVLVREQAYLDDPVRIDAWREIVALNVRTITVTPVSADGETVRLSEDVEGRLRQRRMVGGPSPAPAARVPSRVRVRIEFADGAADREMVLR